MIEDTDVSRWRRGESCEGVLTYLDVYTLSLFDRSAIFACSADLGDVTFARRHSVWNNSTRVHSGACEGGLEISSDEVQSRRRAPLRVSEGVK